MRWLKTASLILVGLVLAIFALMGLLYTIRGTPARSVFSSGDPLGPPAAGDSGFVRSVELLTQTEIRANQWQHAR